MSYELLKRVNVELLHPGLVNRVVEMLSACRAAGFDYWAVSGFRSAQQQHELYERGRTRPDAVVTSAHPFHSAHDFGLAIDFVCDRDVSTPELQAGWDPEEYEELGRQARAHDLLWGGDFSLGGRKHVQLPGLATRTELDRLRSVYLAAPDHGRDARSRERNKLQAVWLHIDVGDAAFV